MPFLDKFSRSKSECYSKKIINIKDEINSCNNRHEIRTYRSVLLSYQNLCKKSYYSKVYFL